MAMKTVIAVSIALLIATAQAEVVVLPAESRGRDFVMEFDATFAKGAPRNVTLKLGFPSQYGGPEDPVSKWRFTKTGLSFDANWTRTLGFIADGYTGTPFMGKGYIPRVNVPDGVKRHVKVVSDKGYVTFNLELDGRMRRVLTNRLYADFNFLGYEIVPQNGVEISDVTVRPVGPEDLPEPRDGFETCRVPGSHKIALHDGQTSFSFVPGGFPVVVKMSFGDGTTNRNEATWESFSYGFDPRLYRAEMGDKKGVEEFQRGGYGGWVTLVDYGMRFSLGNASFTAFTYPKLASRYGAVQTIHMMTNLTAYGEAGSVHEYKCSLLRRNGRNLLYVDGNYAATVGSTNPIQSLTLSLPIGGHWREGPAPAPDPGPLTVKIPDFEPFDTSVCRENMGSFALECDGYLSRGAFEHLNDSFLRRVPRGTYVRARVRCRLGGNTNRNTRVTARLTNFFSPNSAGRSPESITQDTKTLPRGFVGETNVVFEFDAGKIQDVIWQRGFGYLDFEVLGDCRRKHGYTDQGYMKPVGKSDVIVLGAELERAPAGMCIKNGNTCGALYLPDEEAFVTALVEAVVAGRYRVVWTVRDIDKRVLDEGAEVFDLAAGGREERRIVFRAREPGWYRVETRLEDGDGRTILRHDASYVSLAADTRRAGYESPYFMWTGLRSNSSNTNFFKVTMERLRRLGVRKAQVGTFSEKDAEPWGVTLSPIPFIGFSGKPTEAERMAEYESKIRWYMKRFPHATAATIFHESGNCKNRNDPPDPVQDAQEIRKATELCRAWRKVAPQVKLVLGNGNLDKVAQILRNNFPRDLIDAMGEESVGNAVPPEDTVGGEFRKYRELADKYGYTDLPVTPCYEWKCRPRRNFESHRQLAAYRARDVIIALAWGAEHVPVEGGFEPSSCYFMSSWGAGAFSHSPYCYPYPSAAAIATLTRVLDCATYSRLIPTGSATVHAVEFRRDGGECVYALWTPRGIARAKVKFPSGPVVCTGLYGAETKLKPSAEIEIGDEPCYLTAKAPVERIELIPGDREYPFDRYAGIEGARTVLPMDTLDGIVPISNKYPRVESSPAGFRLGLADDPVRGKCIELERSTNCHGKAFCGFKLAKPLLIEGKADTLGIWVKGNSSRGKIYLEIEDATGQPFYTISHYHCYDWCGKMTLDFDGWRFVSFPLTEVSPVRLPGPAPDLQNWFRWGKSWAPPVPPVKFKSMAFTWSDKVLEVNRLVPVPSQTVRVGGLSVY